MKLSDLWPMVKDRFVVIDSALPGENPIGPRNSDALELMRTVPDFTYYTTYPMKPGQEAWFTHSYGMSKSDFKKNLTLYTKRYPQAKGRIKHLSPKKRYKFELAYSYFLSDTYTLLPFLERNKIPFVFLLNPGGAFGFDNDSSDAMLRKVCTSPYFRKVIVNQKYFKQYLLDKDLCDEDRIIYDFTGSVQFKKADMVPKRYFRKDKPTFDICFVAAKYTPLGVDKGYDLFIATAKRLAKKIPEVRFHVVGGFDENEIDVSELGDKIKFYGYVLPATLPGFYAGMDIYMSPDRPNKLYPGNCHGFPLSAGALYCGVCGFNADDLHLNVEFADDEVVIIETKTTDIVAKALYYYEHLDELYAISAKGQKRAQGLYDIEKHIANRVKLFNRLIESEHKSRA